MHARILAMLFLLAFWIPTQLCLADATNGAGSNTVQVVMPNSTLTNVTSVNIGPFIGQGSASESKGDWYSPLSELLRTLLWVGLVAGIVKCFKKEIGELLLKLKSLRVFGQEAGFSEDTNLANQQKNPSASKPETASITTPPETPLATPVPTTIAPKEEPKSVEAKPSEPKAAEPQTSAVAASETDKEFQKAKSAFQLTPTQKEVLAKIEADVNSSPFTCEQKIVLGTMAMAQCIVLGDFWRIYSYIYGSQFEFLQKANISPVKDSEALLHWLAVKEKYTVLAQNSSMELYMKFLIDNGLVVRADGSYQITPKGREFLVWSIANGLILNKNF